jgi:4-amino-4-deoxy-L-arabinose transferase-like glycosyltransferase
MVSKNSKRVAIHNLKRLWGIAGLLTLTALSLAWTGWEWTAWKNVIECPGAVGQNPWQPSSNHNNHNNGGR